MTVYLGTSGYSYQDWKGPFYPGGIADRDMLPFYAREFSAVELNFTYYQIPNPRTMAALAAKTPDGFRFTVKAHRDLTHERTGSPESFRRFREALGPLLRTKKFGCVLAQFPNSYRPSPAARDYLCYLRDQLPGLALVAEFRYAGWVSEATFDLLRELDIGFCCVDEPALKGLMPPVAVSTSSIGYVRFHGRNAAKWYQHEHAWERYDYTYTLEELKEWIPRLMELARATAELYVLANNHWQGQAIDTVRKLRSLLMAAGVDLAEPTAGLATQSSF
jgi:uncharacterized protein YecE (DUF72 family)